MLRHLLEKSARTVRRIRQTKPPLAHAMAVENYKLLFIGGLHRSGTSVLHRLLREHPFASGFSDTGVPEDEGQHLQSVFAPAHEHGGPGLFAFDLRSHLTEESPLITPDNRDKLLREWGAYFDLDRKLLLEKSPPNLVRSRFLQAMFPQASFVFIMRHPAAVALATRKWTRTSVMELLLHWHVAYSTMLLDLKYVNKYQVIRYEDFVESPHRYIDEICDWVGIEGFVPQERVTDQNRKYFSIWEQEYAKERELIEKVFPGGQGPMELFGYSFKPPYVGKYQPKCWE